MRLPGYLGRHSEFIGHVATLMSGKAIAALIALFTMPIVSRLFTPSDFGLAALFVSIVSVISRVSSLKYEAALVLPKDDQEAVTLMALSYRLVLLVCIAILVFVVAHEVSAATLPAFELLGGLRWLLPMAVLLMGTIYIQESWLTRTKSFKVASVSLVVGNATTGGARIGFGALLGSTAGGLVAGHILGMISRLAVQRSASKAGLKAVSSHISWSAIKEVARRYADFPKLNAPAALVFSLGQNLPVLLFGVMFSPAIAGFYAMANQLIRRPVDMVAQSTRRVFLQKAASIHNRGRSLQKAFLLATGTLALSGAPVMAVIWLYGQPLSTWFLGGPWLVAGQYLEIIAPWLFILWVMAPCNSVFIVLREQQFWLLLQVVLTMCRLGVFGLAYLVSAGPEWTLHAFVLVTVSANLITWLTALVLIRRGKEEPPQSRGEAGVSQDWAAGDS